MSPAAGRTQIKSEEAESRETTIAGGPTWPHTGGMQVRVCVNGHVLDKACQYRHRKPEQCKRPIQSDE